MRASIVILTAFACLTTVSAPIIAHPSNHFGSFYASNEVKTAVYAQAIESQPTGLAPSLTSPVPAFMRMIGIPDAWASLDADVTSTIAIVDTGVDINHPELKPYLLEGKNLINEKKPAQDDNGHGTAVAGIIAAVAKAGESSPGLGRWKAKLLPVKALDQFGSGNEEKLTQGIRYAVDQGADIIVLSLGLRRDASGLREAVAYAEGKGVLLIAASGNDAALFGEKAAVQYPAAYPTVVAVAGSDGVDPIFQSTTGPENDVSASWSVQTLAIGGSGTIEMEGTSMGAPQVAAIAAMLKAVHPDWKPVRLRETLRRTARLDGNQKWNDRMGYGLVSAVQAVEADSIIDWREPNDTRTNASEFPLGKEVAGTWRSASDSDWFTFEIPYDGVFSVTGEESKLSLYGDSGILNPLAITEQPSSGMNKQWQLSKGRYWLQANKPTNSGSTSDGYRLVSRFTISPDAREPNNSAAAAYTLPARDQEWVGNFHDRGDSDWTVVTLPKPGILRLSVTTDTTRIDPEVRIQPAGGEEIIVDERADGGNEQWSLNNAKAGKYYFRIANAVSTNPEPVIGTYTASLEYITRKEDFYEPNENALTSTPLSPDKVYSGLMNSNKDQDWYRFTISDKQLVKLSVGHIPNTMAIQVELRNRKLQSLGKWSNGNGQRTLLGEKSLPPGTYYLKITSDRSNQSETYGLRVKFTS
ncbi:S8 family serine peptidase [Cohnella lupini]|uniref:S8 family serine peptidase n=1 Tax=Cohnella lupini TaxID=1294267 RepID=UPI0011C035D5|nr:S8 family serine peptidase [Cohnella lupini]